MGDQPKPFSIIVGIDFSDMSTAALRVALNLAHASGDSIVHLVHVVNPQATSELSLSISFQAFEAEAKKQLAELHASTLTRSRVPVTAQVIVGAPAVTLAKVATDTHADLMVVGTHGRRGLARLVYGSVAEAVTRTAPCSVLTVRPRVLAPEETIEPPCAECAQARASGGKDSSCARHTRHHPMAHTYSQLPEGFGLGSQSFNFPRA